MIPLFLIVLIDMIGIGIVIPLLAPMLLDPAATILAPGTPDSARTFILGLLIAAYPIAQFFGAPMIGGYSDRHGRKKALIISAAGTMTGYFFFAAGIMISSIPLMFAGRLLSGFMSGNISVAYAAIADISNPKEKAKNFGLIGMAFGFGFIIGPYLGGKFSDPSVISWFSYSTPFFFCALLSLINIAAISFVFKETLKQKVNKPINMFTGIANLKKAFGMENLRTLLLVILLLSFGFSFFAEFSQVYWVKKFGMTQAQIGELFAFVGVWIAITQGIINRKVSSIFRPAQVLSFSPLLLAIALLALLIPNDIGTIFLLMPFIAIFQGITYPNYIALLSGLAGKESQGEILGITQSVQSLSWTLPPLVAGLISAYNFSLPIILAGVITILGWIVFMSVFKKENKALFHEV